MRCGWAPLLAAWLCWAPPAAGASAQEVPPDSVDLAGFVALAWAALPRPAAARSDWLASREAAFQANALRKPGLAADAAASWASRHQELEMGPSTVEFGDGSNVDLSLTSAWTLYAGGALVAGERRAQALVQARQGDMAADSLQLLGELRAAYLSALSSRALQEASALSLERLERHLHDLRLREEAGMASEEAVLAARSRLLRARQDLALRTGELRAACLDLGTWCGRPGRELRPTDGLAQPLEGIGAEPRRPARLEVMDAQLRAARAVEEQLSSWRRPRLESSAAWHLARPGVDPVENDWMGYATVGIKLRWTLLDGRLGHRREAEAGHQRHALELRLDDATRESEGQLVRARVRVEAALGAWEECEARLEVERRLQGQVENRWRQGMASEQDWLDAQDDLRQAEWEAVQGAARLRLAENQLLAALGR